MATSTLRGRLPLIRTRTAGGRQQSSLASSSRAIRIESGESRVSWGRPRRVTSEQRLRRCYWNTSRIPSEKNAALFRQELRRGNVRFADSVALCWNFGRGVSKRPIGKLIHEAEKKCESSYSPDLLLKDQVQDQRKARAESRQRVRNDRISVPELIPSTRCDHHELTSA